MSQISLQVQSFQNYMGKKNRTLQVSLRDQILLIFMGMCTFSSFSATLSFDFLHLPVNLPELSFMLFLFILRKQFLPIQFDKYLFVFLLLILVCSVLLSQVVSSYSLYAVLSSSRGYLYLFLFLCIYKRNNSLSLDALLYISFGSLIGWTIACVMAFQKILSNPTEPVQTYGNMIAIAVFIPIAILNKRWRIFLAGLSLLMMISFMSGIRRVILVILMVCFLAIVAYYIMRRISIIKTILISALVSLPLLFIIHPIGNYAEENLPILYYRLFTKTEMFLKGEYSESDDYRINSFRKFQDELTSYLLPQGMVSNQYIDDPKTGIYMDFPFLALSHIFSLPVALLFVFFFLVKTYKSFIIFRLTSDPSPGVFAIVTVVMIIMLFVEGSFLVHPFTTPFTGLCLGKVIYYGGRYDSFNRQRRNQWLEKSSF